MRAWWRLVRSPMMSDGTIGRLMGICSNEVPMVDVQGKLEFYFELIHTNEKEILV